MDETSGGTVTPPRDPDANSGEIAPVIPLRRRSPDVENAIVNGTPDEVSRGIWDPDAPPADLPERPSVRQQPAASELHLRTPGGSDGDANALPDAIAAPPRAPRRLLRSQRGLAAIAATAAALAAVLIVALARGVVPRHTAGRPTAAAKEAASHTAAHSKAASGKRHIDARTRAAAGVTAIRPRRGVRHRAKRTVRLASVPVLKRHAAPSVSAARPPPPAASQTRTAAPSQVLAISAQFGGHRANSVTAARAGAASSCVPGELGC